MMSEARLSEEKARNSMLDAARLAEELRAEQEPVLTGFVQPFLCLAYLIVQIN
jgi:hypothetical protein